MTTELEAGDSPEPDEHSRDLSEIVRGLSQPQKILSPKFFYDERGSQLFEAICELPEYYLTRTELGIMREHVAAISAAVGPRAAVIEFGSGAGVKTRYLLGHLDDPCAYLPVDISGDHLAAVTQEFHDAFPDLEILPVVADFTHPFPLPSPKNEALRNLVYFPGSTIGNFSPGPALDLLRVMRQEAGDGGALLIGVDLRKDPAVLEPAYDDSAGVTAEFNRNMLHRLNREFGFDFDPAAYRHRAFFNSERGRIEMHLVSRRAQRVRGGGREFAFAVGEALITEYSYKYTPAQFEAMATEAGFAVQEAWTDPNAWFSIWFAESK
ncbi:MAG: L-histidine N(alpha)-methyltransferase [Xanthomonadales bacterium]|nr:L-histidine N(alpha)-methyltransferase [Xanthomonadales bacterium]